MKRISLKSIYTVSKQILIAHGVSDSYSEIIADTICYANFIEMHTHGIGRMPLYLKNIDSGTIIADAKMKIVKNKASIALIDANHGFGQVAAKSAIDLGVEKAKKYGIALVGVKNSNNFGVAGYYSRQAAEMKAVSIILANAAPAVAPPGGTVPIFGTNPLSFSLPGSSNNPEIVFDMATTVAARGKIRLSEKKGGKIPFGWALDSAGNPTDDPKKALEGTLLAIGGYKGFGLSFMVDALAGMLTGSAFAGQVKALGDLSDYSASGNIFIFIDPYLFLEDENEYEQRLDTFINNIRNCAKDREIYIPGDSYRNKKNKNIKSVNLPEVQVKEINEIIADLGLSMKFE